MLPPSATLRSVVSAKPETSSGTTARDPTRSSRKSAVGTMPAAAKCSLSTLLTYISIGPKTRRMFESNHWILVLAPPRLKIRTCKDKAAKAHTMKSTSRENSTSRDRPEKPDMKGPRELPATIAAQLAVPVPSGGLHSSTRNLRVALDRGAHEGHSNIAL